MKLHLFLMLFIAVSCSSKSSKNTCESSNPADEMVAVGSWCVDKYEASVWSDHEGTGQAFFTNSDEAHDSNTLYPTGDSNVPKGCMRDGEGCKQFAVSKKGAIPARAMTWMQAARFCANSGKELVPDHIWQVAAMGTQNVQTGTGGLTGGSAEDGEAARCNVALPKEIKWDKWLSDNSGVRMTGKAGKTKASDKSCISEFGVEDMVGNLLEYTGSNNLQAKMYADILEKTMVTKKQKRIGPLKPAAGAFADQNTWGITGSAYGCDGPDVEMGVCDVKSNVHAVALRGGSWHSGPYASVKYVSLRHNSAHSQWTIGFRCARPR